MNKYLDLVNKLNDGLEMAFDKGGIPNIVVYEQDNIACKWRVSFSGRTGDVLDAIFYSMMAISDRSGVSIDEIMEKLNDRKIGCYKKERIR